MNNHGACLVYGQDERFGDVYVRGAGRRPDDFLGDVRASQRLESGVHALGCSDIALEANEGKLGLDQTRLYFGNADGRVD